MIETIVFVIALFMSWTSVKGHVVLTRNSPYVSTIEENVAFVFAILTCIAWGIFYYLKTK
jgi:hypothetical protein